MTTLTPNDKGPLVAQSRGAPLPKFEPPKTTNPPHFPEITSSRYRDAASMIVVATPK